jgi:GDP/UDP-N,N'-diacetylbacillosamine 2-epimerase (hydrolysing)
MNKQKKICVATGSRSEYGLLYWLMKAIKDDPTLNLQVLVTGTHLEKKFGNTKSLIRKDGFKLSACIPSNIVSDDPVSVANSMATTLKGSSLALKKLNPDAVILLGDRFEIFAVAQACLILNIPVIHIHGGEVTEGSIDDCFRHSISKLSKLHFPSTEFYKKRLIQLGEDPNFIYNFGAPGLEAIRKLRFLKRTQLEEKLNIKFGSNNILFTYHPITVSKKISNSETKEVLLALHQLNPQIHLFITMPNADSYSEVIRTGLLKLMKQRKNTYLFENLGQLNYLSLAAQMDLVVGNSSSGIIEIPFLGISVIDIGIRQKGRVRSNLVLNVRPKSIEIEKMIHKLLILDSPRKKVRNYIYGDGTFSRRALKKIKIFLGDIPKFKSFHDAQ